MLKTIFKSEIKRNAIPYLITIGISIVALILILSLNGFNVNSNYYWMFYSLQFTSFVVTIVVICVTFSYNKTKVGCDLYYSLPISKMKLYITKTLIGLLVLSVNYLLFSLLTIPFMYAQKNIIVDYGQLFGTILVVCFSYLIVFLALIPFYYFANSKGDGFIYLIFGTFCFPLIAYCFVGFLDFGKSIHNSFNYDYYIFTKSALFNLPMSFISQIRTYDTNTAKLVIDIYFFNNLSSFGNIFPVVCYFLSLSFYPISLLFINKDKAERSEQVDSSFFGFQTFIPISIISLSLLCICYGLPFLLTYLIYIIFFILYIIFRKSIKFKISDYIILGVGLIFLTVMVIAKSYSV